MKFDILWFVAWIAMAASFGIAKWEASSTRSEYAKWCVEKAETKEQVLICQNGKFPWEK